MNHRGDNLIFSIGEMLFTVPKGVTINALDVHKIGSRNLSFATAPLRAIVEASGGHPYWLTDANFVADLVCAWYEAYRREGGKPHPILEELFDDLNSKQWKSASAKDLVHHGHR